MGRGPLIFVGLLLGSEEDPPGCGRRLILLLLLHFLAEPLTTAQPVAALDGGFVLGQDRSESFLEEGREPQGHTVNLDRGNKRTFRWYHRNNLRVRGQTTASSPAYLGAFVRRVGSGVGEY